MKRNIILWVGAVVLIVIVWIGLSVSGNVNNKSQCVSSGGMWNSTTLVCTKTDSIKGTSPRNTTYTIGGVPVTLVDGYSEVAAAPGSASQVITTYFGNEISHDFDADGRPDTALVLTQTTGGSGTFYYVVVALNTQDGYVGSNALLLGDRIAPQSSEMSQTPGKEHILVINYADRKPGEKFSTAPSVGTSVWLIFDLKTMQLGEVAQNFEGEADPARMKLNMKTWSWISATYSDGKKIIPKDSSKFQLTFTGSKNFSAKTDCNGVGGEYSVNKNKIVFSKMVSTLMYCEGSQEADFTKLLGQIDSYHFTSKGELVFDLKYDSGVVVFK